MQIMSVLRMILFKVSSWTEGDVPPLSVFDQWQEILKGSH